MTARLLSELSALFALEARDAELRKRPNEAEVERLYDISEELHERCGAELARENGCVELP